MSQSSQPTPRAPFPARPVIGLLLRATLAFSLLQTGLTHYLLQRAGAGGVPTLYDRSGRPVGMGMATNGMNGVPGWETVMQYLAPIQVAVGVAVFLGFFTTRAATLAGFLILVPSAAQTVMMIAGAPSGNPDLLAMMIIAGGSSNDVSIANAFLASAVVWLSASGNNPLSLDAIIFKTGRQGSRTPDPDFLGPFRDPIPASVPPGQVAKEFDPSIVETEPVDPSDPSSFG